MEQGTSNYSMLVRKAVYFILFFALTLSLQAQNPESDKDKKDSETVYFPLYNGLIVSADLYGLGANVMGSDFLSSEIAIEASLKNRFFPVVEIGYGSTDAWSDKGTHYKSSAPYFRIGFNYNTMYKKGKPSYLYVGARYAYTTFSYDVASLSMQDPEFGGIVENPSHIDDIWGGSIPFSHQGLDSSMSWFELLVGVRAKIYKNFYMGWSVRLKYRMSTSLSDYGDPWYIPGFGEYGSSNIGLTYSVIYKLPF